jgi:hypothetical protein
MLLRVLWRVLRCYWEYSDEYLDATVSTATSIEMLLRVLWRVLRCYWEWSDEYRDATVSNATSIEMLLSTATSIEMLLWVLWHCRYATVSTATSIDMLLWVLWKCRDATVSTATSIEVIFSWLSEIKKNIAFIFSRWGFLHLPPSSLRARVWLTAWDWCVLINLISGSKGLLRMFDTGTDSQEITKQ